VLQSIRSATGRADAALTMAGYANQLMQHEVALILGEAALQARGSATAEIHSIIGRSYQHLGQGDMAARHLNAGLELARGDDEKELELAAQILSLYADPGARMLTGDKSGPQTLFRMYEFVTARLDALEDPAFKELVLFNLGFTWHHIGKAAQLAARHGIAESSQWAGTYFRNSIDLTEQSLSLAHDLNNVQAQGLGHNQMAMNYIELGEWKQAAENLGRSEELLREAGGAHPEIAARMLYNRSRIQRAQSDHAGALESFRACLDGVEQLRAAIRSESFLVSSFGEFESLYEEFILYAIEHHPEEDILFYVESIKSRTLLDLLEASGSRAKGLLEDAYGDELREIEGRIRMLRQSIGELEADADPSLRQRLEKELKEATRNERALHGAGRRQLPDGSPQQFARPLHFEKIREVLSS
jgi:tetratricopeptide (TPR) repeat protein